MKFDRGVIKRLRYAGFETGLVSPIVSRLEHVVPHIAFGAWKLRLHAIDEPAGRVLWKGTDRRSVEVQLLVPPSYALYCTCQRGGQTISPEDYRFLIGLALEAAVEIGRSRDWQSSLSDFGTDAVAVELMKRISLAVDPVSLLRFLIGLSEQTYENQRLSFGLIITPATGGQGTLLQAIDNKRLKRLTDGFSTALVLDASGNVHDYVALHTPINEGLRTPRRPWWSAGLAEASARLGGIGIALVRNGDLIIVHDGRLLFSRRSGRWRIWNHAAVFRELESGWHGRGAAGSLVQVLSYLYHCALDLSFRRSGGLLVVVESARRVSRMLMSRTDMVGKSGRGVAEQALDKLVSSTPLYRIDRRIVTDMASLDGALVVDRSGQILAYGAMTRLSGGARQGARTRAAAAASRYGVAIKVSSDGGISVFSKGKLLLDL